MFNQRSVFYKDFIFLTTHTLSDMVSGEARLIPIYNVDTKTNNVAVTFNCAISSDIDRILDEYDIKCTFFCLAHGLKLTQMK